MPLVSGDSITVRRHSPAVHVTVRQHSSHVAEHAADLVVSN